MLNFKKDLKDFIGTKEAAPIIEKYNRGLLTLWETLEQIYKADLEFLATNYTVNVAVEYIPVKEGENA